MRQDRQDRQEPLILLDQVVLGYGRKKISNPLTIDFNHNEVVVLLGANGCGKTTLLKTALRLILPLSGHILLKNRDQAKWQRRALAKLIGYVPQAQSHLFAFDVEDIILMGRTAYIGWGNSPAAEDYKIVQDVVARLGIEKLQKKRYPELSGGEKRLVLIARALVQQPEVLIMDEPTASLDYGNQLRILEQVLALKAEGMTILMTTHQPEHAYQVADRLLLMHNGEILADGVGSEVLTTRNLATIYQLEERIIQQNLNFAKITDLS